MLRLTATLCVHPLTSVLNCGTSYGIFVNRWVRAILCSVRNVAILVMGTLSDAVHLLTPRTTSLFVGPPSSVTFRLKSLPILRDRLFVVRFSRTVNDAPFSSPTSRLGLPTLLGMGTGIGLVNTFVTLLPNEPLRCLETIEVSVLPTDRVIGLVNPVYDLSALLI